MKAKKAFTLIELLVVMAVITPLMALLFPALSRARKQARAVVCQAKLRQWGLIFKTYLDDNDGRFFGNVPRPHHAFLHDAYWYDQGDLGLCPMATQVVPAIWGETFAAWRQQPSTMEGRTWFVSMSYGFNPFLTHPDDPAGREQHWRHCNIRRAANVPVIFDSLHIAPQPQGHFSPPEYEGQVYHWFGAVCINRHNQATNMLFLDWSLRRVGIKEHWTLKWGPLSDTAGPWTLAGGVQPTDWPQWMRKFKDY